MGAAGEPTGRPKRRQGGLARDGLPPGARSRGWFAYYHLHNNQKIVVSATADAVTINKRPGDVYAFSDARFGRWAYGDQAVGDAGNDRAPSRDGGTDDCLS